jgi:putative DNA primase/helicase
MLPEQWDFDDWALSTPGGIVDLRTGGSRPARREDYATKSTAVTPGGDCQRWLAFLDHVTNHDGDLQLFLQRMLGYCLTGSVRDHALFFLYGSGSNGKSTFVETARSILGSYSRTAPTGMLMASNYDRHPTDIAGLRGIRMAVTTEVEEGRVWDSARIRSLTGGDSITARGMRQDFFDFDPKFKLVIAGNDKPVIRKVDEAIRRRFHVVPFCVKITQPDPDFREKLVDEWPGILAWMIKGCRMWQEQGLSAPRAVADATADYLEQQDVVGRWIADTCEMKPSAKTPIADLFASWNKWCEAADEECTSKKALSDALTQRSGISRGQSGHEKTRVMVGIRLRTQPPTSD